MKLAGRLRSLFGFRGRAGRGEFWAIFAVVLAGAAATGPVAQALTSGGAGFGPLALWGLVTIVPLIAVTARRFHDYELSGWWMILALVPVVGPLFVLWVALLSGTEGANRFGPEPRGNRPA